MCAFVCLCAYERGIWLADVISLMPRPREDARGLMMKTGSRICNHKQFVRIDPESQATVGLLWTYVGKLPLERAPVLREL